MPEQDEAYSTVKSAEWLKETFDHATERVAQLPDWARLRPPSVLYQPQPEPSAGALEPLTFNHDIDPHQSMVPVSALFEAQRQAAERIRQLELDGADTREQLRLADTDVEIAFQRIAALERENAAQRQTIRRLAIETRGPGTWGGLLMHCRRCNRSWYDFQPERHAAGCQAAPEGEG